MKRIFCDLDGVIFDNSKRYMVLRNSKRSEKDYELYHSSCDQDEYLPLIPEILSHFPLTTHIHFVTGRSELSREATLRAIRKYFNPLFPIGCLHMKPLGFNVPNVLFKRDFFNSVGLNSQDLVIDDLKEVITMAREEFNANVLWVNDMYKD